MALIVPILPTSIAHIRPMWRTIGRRTRIAWWWDGHLGRRGYKSKGLVDCGGWTKGDEEGEEAENRVSERLIAIRCYHTRL